MCVSLFSSLFSCCLFSFSLINWYQSIRFDLGNDNNQVQYYVIRSKHHIFIMIGEDARCVGLKNHISNSSASIKLDYFKKENSYCIFFEYS